MSLPLRAPRGASRPQGARHPRPARAPWHVPTATLPTVSGLRERRAATRAVRRTLRSLTLADGPPCRILVHEDLSGSMDAVAAAREIVLTELLSWLSAQLRPWDEVGVTSFGGDACVRLEPTPADRELVLADAALASYCTLLGSTWDLVDVFAPYTPRAGDDGAVLGTPRTVSVLVSDGYIADLGAAGSRARSTAVGVDAVGLLLPDGRDRAAPRCWTHAYPDGAVLAVDPHDAGRLAGALAELIAELTGRELVDGRTPPAGDGDLRAAAT